MNKISIKLIILYFIFTANLVSNPKVDVKTAILIDHDSNKIIYELEPDMSIYPASMTKIMTSIVVFDLLKKNKLSLDDKFVITACITFSLRCSVLICVVRVALCLHALTCPPLPWLDLAHPYLQYKQ